MATDNQKISSTYSIPIVWASLLFVRWSFIGFETHEGFWENDSMELVATIVVSSLIVYFLFRKKEKEVRIKKVIYWILICLTIGILSIES
ncbi:hypothetical protein A2454_06200 [Candidatus Peribacteria bacterium RIFOXYC2_FULL_55_14]|nr:MAG: hypothetical protein A2198_03365 [Candidatus Peribacteria bacterium RIFOXYA1_FULL_56_14]OGJ72753.1 MAG: hypothetical protein A2217_04695 [Candidatus Peribacteria bacterium RIFOXYA2_FULL_55_28]OGJ75342.1 MAG: hypothetical protein A2384_00360 [Candidatus Peribacteria bacterium RIFOXYB1_FULL_54_35]OGJ76481.1 MAG: hypothetical protein A2327_01510 [Candidatus Peribacteria bacterium RIFOXYB2_FULL_54_17]OGJ79498.1 MAG: hypothetical protein A2424_01745 [Candidatus Peribacteria bacterium RIFOXYC